ncbi:MAG: hypothetical protein JWQ07_4720 [Ramlibacter sp.]|nr:hypothetical protein [Ramlibacter sp.]
MVIAGALNGAAGEKSFRQPPVAGGVDLKKPELGQ